ncbi:MAG: hypothetical protein R2880_02655 [Deinococcales bacterium]
MPHWYYVREYCLGETEAPWRHVLLNSFTLEDAELSLNYLKDKNITSLAVLSSDFHMARVRLVYRYYFGLLADSFKYLSTSAEHSAKVYQQLIAHEEKALRALQLKLGLGD